MLVGDLGVAGREQFPRLRGFGLATVRNEDELTGLEGSFIRDYAVLRNAMP